MAEGKNWWLDSLPTRLPLIQGSHVQILSIHEITILRWSFRSQFYKNSLLVFEILVNFWFLLRFFVECDFFKILLALACLGKIYLILGHISTLSFLAIVLSLVHCLIIVQVFCDLAKHWNYLLNQTLHPHYFFLKLLVLSQDICYLSWTHVTQLLILLLWFLSFRESSLLLLLILLGLRVKPTVALRFDRVRSSLLLGIALLGL